MSEGRATLIGFGAVLLWSLFALLTVQVGPVPPFQLAALSFLVGGGVGLAWAVLTGQRPPAPRDVHWAVWPIGVGGIFGYHFFYFTALSTAPPAQANLINYLWPLLIVIFSGLLPGERLRPGHLVGAGVAFSGAMLALAGPGGAPTADAAAGYAAALACALIWSGYSVSSRRFGTAPTSTVTIFCFAAAALAGLSHLALEETAWPSGAAAWAALVLIGLGPVGAAFYLWDIGMKKGNIQLLGAASYAAPALSTLALVAAGAAEASASLAGAAFLIALGAAVAARAERVRPGATTARSLPSDEASAP
jgi:drug/metabolite transporter (DMT)-like permease